MNDSGLCYVYKGNISNIDGFRCFLTNFAATLYAYNLGYFCMGLTFLIIFISIFGGIKQNYKWFILNQAIWDLFVSHQNSCENIIAYLVKPGITCIYTALPKMIIGLSADNSYYTVFFSVCIINNPYSSLLLITGSRFIAIFYLNLYDKLTRGRRILRTLIIFNFVAFFFELYILFISLRITRKSNLFAQCQAEQNLTIQSFCKTQIGYDIIYNILDICYKIFIILSYLKPILCLILSIIAASMLILRLIKQAKFQKKHNPKDFNNSVRITIVIFGQTLINLFVLILESLNGFIHSLPSVFNINILQSRSYVEGKDYTGYIDLRLPLWLGGSWGLVHSSSRQMFIQIRVFIECILVLCVMAGYREAIIDFVKKIFSVLRNHSKVFQQSVPNFFRSSKTSTNETSVMFQKRS